jgi:hypothetical protein
VLKSSADEKFVSHKKEKIEHETLCVELCRVDNLPCGNAVLGARTSVGQRFVAVSASQKSKPFERPLQLSRRGHEARITPVGQSGV